jgi:hypothetical protein
MTLVVGKLYSCDRYLMIYPNKVGVVKAINSEHGSAACISSYEASASYRSGYWTAKLKQTVYYCDPGSPILVLSLCKSNDCAEVLIRDIKGWIYYQDWMHIKEIA